MTIGMLRTMCLTDHAKDAVFIDPPFQHLQQPFLLLVTEGITGRDIQTDARAGIELIDMLAAGAAAAGKLKLQTVCRNCQI